MRYSTQPKYREHVKRYSFLSFAKQFSDIYGKKSDGYCSKNRNKCSKNYYKEIVQKPAEATEDLIGNKIADKINSVGKSKEKEKTKKVEEILNN